MSNSGSRINYNIRTAKSVERKMILNTAKELFKNFNIAECRYIGFGSPFFTDFKLFHKELHIDNMISFEVANSLEKRIEFNKPYKCIHTMIGKSTDLFNQIDWTQNIKDFIWTDYDNELEYDMFNDAEIIFSKINYGSIYLMSCNRQLKNYTIEKFKENFGELSPIDINDKDFTSDFAPNLIRKMFLTKIKEIISQRNLSLSENEKLEFRQLFYFTYQDGAPMISFGGFIDYINPNFNLTQKNLNNFEFIKTEDEKYAITPPNLTYKEIYLLNAHLPNSSNAYIGLEELDFIPNSDKEKYRKLYKFLPIFMDVVN